MIPKIIHYCWFGRKPLPPLARRCIASWRRFLPDYEIVEWNEDNFDVNRIPYTAEAYAAGKYAFVSDYARFSILYDRGGLYFDTDVELIAPIDDIIAAGPFMGMETDGIEGRPGNVAPGLGLGTDPGTDLYKTLLDYYADLHFDPTQSKALAETETIVFHTTKVLLDHGLTSEPGIQRVAGVNIYPKEYFNPWEFKSGRPYPTANTRSIHWYSMTWLSPRQRMIQKLKYAANRLLGQRVVAHIKRLFS